MPINQYDKPADYQFMNTYVPYGDVAAFIYKTGAAKQAKADANRKAAEEASKEAGGKLAWYDVLANDRIKQELSGEISEINIDPSTGQYNTEVSRIINKYSQFYGVSAANEGAADAIVKAPSSSEYRSGSEWDRHAVRNQLDFLETASRKHSRGGTGALLDMGISGLQQPQYIKYTDFRTQMIDRAAKINNSGWKKENGALYERSGSSWVGVKARQIAAVNGFDFDTKRFISDDARKEFFSSDAGRSADHDAKYLAFGGIEGDPQLREKIDIALSSNNPDEVISFIDYDTGRTMEMTVGEIQETYGKALTSVIESALTNAEAYAHGVSSKSYDLTDAGRQRELDKKLEGKPGLRVPENTEILGPDLVNLFTKSGYNLGAARSDMRNAALTLIEKYDPYAAQTMVGKSDEEVAKFANRISNVVMQKEGGDVAVANWNEANNNYNNANSTHIDLQGQISNEYDKFSAANVGNGDKARWYDDIMSKHGPIRGMNKDNVDKYILAFSNPDKYWMLTGLNSQKDVERIKATLPVETDIATGRRNEFSWSNIASGLEIKLDKHIDENKTVISTGNYLRIPAKDGSEDKLLQQIKEAFSVNPTLFLDQKTINGQTMLNAIKDAAENAQVDVNTDDLMSGLYDMRVYLVSNASSPTGMALKYIFTDKTPDAEDPDESQPIVINNVAFMPGSDIADRVSGVLVDQAIAYANDASEKTHEKITQLSNTYQDLGGLQAATYITAGFDPGENGMTIHTKWGRTYDAKSVYNSNRKLMGYTVRIVDNQGKGWLLDRDDIEKATGGGSVISNVNDFKKFMGYDYVNSIVGGSDVPLFDYNKTVK